MYGEVAPLAAAVMEPFARSQLALFGVSATFGFGLTTTATVLVAVQPEADVPVMV